MGADYGPIKGDLDARTAIASPIIGVGFGWALTKGLVYLPTSVILQFTFQKWVMMKMFLGAVMASAAINVFISFVNKEHGQYRVRDNKDIISTVLGTLMLGAGMALTGSCPGTVYAQLGAGVLSSIWVWVGGIAAVFIYAYMYEQVFQKLEDGKKPSKPLLDEAAGIPYWTLGTALAVGMFFLIGFIEYKYPWHDDVPSGVKASGRMYFPHLHKAWSPIMAGILIGCLQLPMKLIVHDTLGSTRSFSGLVSFIMGTLSDALGFNIPNYFQARKASGNLWQFLYCMGAVGGAFLAAHFTDIYAFEKGPPMLYSFLGGMCMVLGALIAGGCTSGHGVSGVSDLNAVSMIGAAAMFGGAIGTAMLLEQFDIHPLESKSMWK